MAGINLEIFSVSQINKYIKGLMDGDGILRDVTVSGEISNFKRHSSGHYYFSVKDQGSALSAAMFKWQNRTLTFMPENGMRVLVHGRISVYEPSGQYQIIADSIRPDGVGALYEQYERLKRALENKGYFDPSRKKQIPQFPGRIAVITSPTGAAIRDILNILGRRYPLAAVDVYPSEVQGENAPAMLASALYAANRNADCDVIIIGRGGGSMEDLWAFNSVDVIKAIIDSEIPVISAVGHETDFTLSDFVADLRAPTPSAAAELAVPDSAGVLGYLGNYRSKTAAALERKIIAGEAKIAAVMNMQCMKNPMTFTENKSRQLDEVISRMESAVNERLHSCESDLRETASKLVALNPLAVLARGYSVAYMEDVPLKSVKSLAEGDRIKIRFTDGSADCRVEKTSLEEIQ